MLLSSIVSWIPKQRDEHGLNDKAEIEFFDLIHSSDQKWK